MMPIPSAPMGATARRGRIIAMAREGLGVDDIQVRTGEPYRTIAAVLRAGPLARLAKSRHIAERRKLA